MQTITLTNETRRCFNSNVFLGYEGENNANKLVFEFTDGFVDGLAVLKVKRGEQKGTIELEKVDETYELEVKSSLVSVKGDITFQCVITQANGTIIKYDPFVMTVKDAIDTDAELPEEYPSWQEIIATELEKVEEATQKANEVSNQLLEDKENGVFDGKDGFSPTVLVKTNTDAQYILEVTYKDEKGNIQTYETPNLKGQGGSVSDYSELTNKPKINGIELSGNKTNEELGIPTKLSELSNDSGFITNTVNNLLNYYLKSETYTKEEVNTLIGNLSSFNALVVTELPIENISTSTIYLIANTNQETNNYYDEYLYINSKWEKIGTTQVDLTNYYTKTEVDNLIPTVPTKVSELENDSNFVSDTNYVHTDNNFTNLEKQKLEELNNYDDTEIKEELNDKANLSDIPNIEGLATTEQLEQGLSTKQDILTAGDNITIKNGVISASGGGSSGGVSEWEKITTDISAQNFENSILQLTISTDLTSKINKGTRLKYKDSGDTKYGIIVDYDSTNLYVFCGQYTINGNVSNLEYSNMYSPVGFPTDKNLWKVEVQNSDMYFEKNPGNTQIYNLGDISITIPRGLWDLMYQVCYQIGTAASTSNAKYMTVGLGEDASSFKTEYTTACAGYSTFIRDTTTKDCGVLTLDNAKTFYFNERNDGIESSAGLGMPIYLLNSETKLIIRATSIYV